LEFFDVIIYKTLRFDLFYLCPFYFNTTLKNLYMIKKYNIKVFKYIEISLIL